MKQDKEVFNPEDLNIPSNDRIKADLSEEQLRYVLSLRAVHNADNSYSLTGYAPKGNINSSEFIILLNEQFISDVKLLIKKGLLLSESHPLALKIAGTFRNKNSVITDSTKALALELIEKAEITDKKTGKSSADIRVQASEIVRGLIEENKIPVYIPDHDVFFSVVHSLMKRGKGKKTLNSYISRILPSAPVGISDKQVLDIVKAGNHNSRQETKRAIEKNKRSQYLLSAVRFHFASYHNCCKKEPLVRIRERVHVGVHFVKAFCYTCRTSQYYQVEFRMSKPETLASRVSRSLDCTLKGARELIEKGAASRVFTEHFLEIEKAFTLDNEIWKSEKARWTKEFQTWISRMNRVSNVPQGAGLGSRVSDRKHRNRIRTR